MSILSTVPALAAIPVSNVSTGHLAATSGKTASAARGPADVASTQNLNKGSGSVQPGLPTRFGVPPTAPIHSPGKTAVLPGVAFERGASLPFLLGGAAGTEEPGFQASLGKGVVRVSSEGQEVDVEFGPGYTIAFRAMESQHATVAVENGMHIDGIWPGVDERTQVQPRAYVDDLVIRRWTGQSSWTFSIGLQGVRLIAPPASLRSAEAFEIVTGQGRVLGYIPVSRAIGTSGASSPVTMTYADGDLTFGVSSTWLQNALARGPVSIDPSVVLSGSSPALTR